MPSPRFLRHSQRTKVPELAEGPLPLRAGPQTPAPQRPGLAFFIVKMYIEKRKK